MFVDSLSQFNAAVQSWWLCLLSPAFGKIESDGSLDTTVMLSSLLHQYRSFGILLLAVTVGLPLSGAQVNAAAADAFRLALTQLQILNSL